MLRKIKKTLINLMVWAVVFMSLSALADSYAPETDWKYPSNVYWGDTHLHTNLSLDAYIYGNTGLGAEQAYRFAKGEPVIATNGMTAKLSRPLDFLVIADHASNMGLMQELEAKNSDVLSSPLGKKLAYKLDEINRVAEVDKTKAVQLADKLLLDGFTLGQVKDDPAQLSIWKAAATLADQHNQPGQFTTFIGYEWTQLFYKLHRVVIFKDDANKVGEEIPFSQYDSNDPELLWAYLEDYENRTGGEVLAIPHNGNLSQGVMFALEGADGKPLSVDYAETRSRWEPLFEVTQIKGDSEAHPDLSPTDTFADYETVPNVTVTVYSEFSEKLKKQLKLTDYDSWIKQKINRADKFWNYEYGYARPALKLGLQQQHKLGVNPFKFGMLGSTDAHTSLSTADENNFWGKLSRLEPYPNRILGSWGGPGTNIVPDSSGFFSRAWRASASGYAAIWAEENTRESLFAAMKRKEVYASTGPRIRVRFFGGWDYQADDAFRPNFAKIGYSKGVPMGGDITQGPEEKSPTFLIRAVKDPDGANLDRVQIVKGWLDKQGRLHEKIYDVALADRRNPNWRGRVKPVGDTVNISDASYTNTIGAPELAVVWPDPDFNANELAFYYVRVLEIPTPRWTAYDAKVYGIKDIPDEIPMVTQERAYTSPIWYSPITR